MNEGRWNSCDDPDRMLDFLWSTGRASERRCRLFACACVRRVWNSLPDDASRKVIEVAEQQADGLSCDQALVAARASATDARDVEAAPDEQLAVKAAGGTAWDAAEVTDLYAGDLTRAASQVSWYAAWAFVDMAAHCNRCFIDDDSIEAFRPVWLSHERMDQAAILRDIFGNPFHPLVLDPKQVTTKVLTLAQAIYDGQQFGRLPELADALEDAGCDEAGVLEHLRGPGPHARGCHVLDLILGKS